MKRSSIKYLLLLASLLLAGLALLSICIISSLYDGWMYQVKAKPALQQDLGFATGSPYINAGGVLVEVLTVEDVVPGGIFDKAGVQKGDIIVDYSLTELYRELEKNRGGSLTIPVVNGGDGPPLRSRPTRNVTIEIPLK
jgi:hypothetical protein